MITTKNLTFSYNRKGIPVINDFTLSLDRGSICGLLGKNGAGKSTLLYLLAGLLRPDSGKILCNGFVPYQRNTSFLEDIMIVPEEFFVPGMSLEQYVNLNEGFYPKFNRQEMLDYLQIFELEPSLHFAKCSMGQKKKALLSFALACNTSILLLDEPTNGLDISSKRSFRKVVSKAMTDEKIILISTHQLHDVEKILDHTIIMDSSHVLLNCSLMDIASQLNFRFVPGRDLGGDVLIALEAPGGYNIAELSDGNPDNETEVNLETLFELVQQKPEIIAQLLNK